MPSHSRYLSLEQELCRPRARDLTETAVTRAIRKAGLVVNAADQDRIGGYFWHHAFTTSSMPFLVVTLWHADIEDVTDGGLDHLFDIADRILANPGAVRLTSWVKARSKQLSEGAGGNFICQGRRGFLHFLGNQPVTFDGDSLRCHGIKLGVDYMISIMNDEPEGIFRLRSRLVSGQDAFDQAMAPRWADIWEKATEGFDFCDVNEHTNDYSDALAAYLERYDISKLDGSRLQSVMNANHAPSRHAA